MSRADPVGSAREKMGRKWRVSIIPPQLDHRVDFTALRLGAAPEGPMRHVVTQLMVASRVTAETAAAVRLQLFPGRGGGKGQRPPRLCVPSGRTADATKPDVIALANAILAKLP
jgi:hypothetical protein